MEKFNETNGISITSTGRVMKLPYRGTHVSPNGYKRLSSDQEIDLLALEQLRLLVSRIDLLSRQRNLRVLAVTSSVAAEGKTTIATNLAMVMAVFFGKKTLLIDADFRHPGVAAKLGDDKSFTHGFSEVLKGEISPTAARWQMFDKQLTVLPLTKPEPNIAPLLTDPMTRARFQEAIAGFNSVIIDLPPVLPLADTHLFSDLVDGFLFVVRANKTPKQLISSATKMIQDNKLIGFILNEPNAFNRAAYGYHHGPGYY